MSYYTGMRFIRITIIRTGKPEKDNLNQELQYLGESLGLFSERDKDKSCFRIFIVLVKSLKTGRKLTSDEIADQTNLSRGTVIHHLNRLMESGIVVSQKNFYMLAVDSIEELVDMAKTNINKTFDNLKITARNIDKKLELK
jgi:predicted transcriptional regulator